MPASRQRRRSSSKALAVTATIGGGSSPSRRHGAGGCARVASRPSSTRHVHVHQHELDGRIEAGQMPRNTSTASRPFAARTHLAAGLLQQPSGQQRVDVVVLDQQHRYARADAASWLRGGRRGRARVHRSRAIAAEQGLRPHGAHQIAVEAGAAELGEPRLRRGWQHDDALHGLDWGRLASPGEQVRLPSPARTSRRPAAS